MEVRFYWPLVLKLETMAARGNMRPCGCHRGRPCTCEMGPQQLPAALACGERVNCLLNAKAVRKKRRPARKCVRHEEFVAEQLVDRLEIAPGCVLRMRKPDWDVSSKSAFYTLMRQLRLGLFVMRVNTSAVIEQHKTLREKYNCDLLKAEETLQRVQESRSSPAGARKLRMTPNYTHVDSDVFDSHSTQLIPAETLLPGLRTRLQAINHAITNEERTLELVEAYVGDVAASKLQATVRGYQRAKRWKRIWWIFREDVEWAAAVTIQSTLRMKRCKQVLPFLRHLRHEKATRVARSLLRRFWRKLCLAKRELLQQASAAELVKIQAQKLQATQTLHQIASRIFKRMALWRWRERQREATANDEREALTAAVTIQRHWRGLRERLNYRRIQYRYLLSEPLRELYDRFVVHGNLWQLLFEVDASFRRYEGREHDEKEDAKTFVAEFVQNKREYEDRMMHDWLTASALDSPVVKGAKGVLSAFSIDPKESEGFSLPDAVLRSPMARDLKRISAKKTATLFPDNLPADVIRLAMYKGFNPPDVVTVMRGLIAQGKRADDPKTVLKHLKQRTPLMMNPWKPERVTCQETTSQELHIMHQPRKSAKVKRIQHRPHTDHQHQMCFLPDNMIDNIPGGLNGSIDRLLLVAGTKCVDPHAKQGAEQTGRFVFRLEATTDPWRSYQHATSSLAKIRREQVVHEALQPYLQVLKKHHCFSVFDLLHKAHGVDEVVSWGLPRPLVVSIFDVIESLHHQTVNRSDRNIQRQMRVSAQFQAFVEPHKNEKIDDTQNSTLAATSTHVRTDCDREHAMKTISDAIYRDVLELPVRELSTPAKTVLFKAYFLLCDTSTGSIEFHSNQQHPPNLSRNNYDDFLADVMMAQVAGDNDRVKQYVCRRVEVASQLAAECYSRLESVGITCAWHMKGLQAATSIHLNDQLTIVLGELLSSLTDGITDNAEVGSLCPDDKRNTTATRSSPSPFVIHNKHAIDSLDESLRNVKIPF